MKNKPKLFDVFLFLNELDLLDLRLKTLYSVVDYFIITEINETFSGEPKSLIFEKNRKRFKEYEKKIIYNPITKKELLKMSGQRDKLQRSLGGITKMKKIPDLVFVIDTNYESLAIKESIKLGIPIVAILDTNSNPEGIDFPIPGNDDARRSIDLYCNLLKETINNAKKDAPTSTDSNTNLDKDIGKKISDKTFDEKKSENKTK